MNKEFMMMGFSSCHDLGCWLGQWMLYDGGLCVNRDPEEHAESYSQFVAGAKGLAI